MRNATNLDQTTIQVGRGTETELLRSGTEAAPVAVPTRRTCLGTELDLIKDFKSTVRILRAQSTCRLERYKS